MLHSLLPLLKPDLQIKVSDPVFLQLNALIVDILAVLTNVSEIETRVSYQCVALANCMETLKAMAILDPETNDRLAVVLAIFAKINTLQ